MRIETTTFLQGLTHTLSALLPSLPCPPLQAAQSELRRTLHLAFGLASAHRQAVVVEPSRNPAKGQIAVRLPEGVRWGCPSAVPLPPSLSGSGWRGGRPRPITVMPQHRAAANVWFLHHGRHALCLRLDLSGAVELLRYRPLLGTWVSC